MRAAARALSSGVLAASVALALGGPALAAPGDLDPSFGGDGKVTTGFFCHNDKGRDVAVRRDGKIVVAGRGCRGFGVVRYLPDGSRDPSFGEDGKVVTELRDEVLEGQALTLHANGKLTVVGFSDSDFALARYRPGGSLARRFGDGGVVRTDLGSKYDEAEDVALQADGKLVVVGTTGNVFEQRQRFAVARYLLGGRLDPSFGDGGVVRTSIREGSDTASAVAVQPNGRIVVAGTTWTEGKFAVVRYLPDGSLDPSFGGDGRVTTDVSAFGEGAQAVALQPDGRILVAGLAGGADTRFALVRYLRDGILDPTFGAGGIVTTSFGPGVAAAFDIALQQDGKIVVGGEAGGENRDFALARYLPDGELDPSFGTGGTITTDFGSFEEGLGVALQADGRIVVAGRTLMADGRNDNFAVARYLVG